GLRQAAQPAGQGAARRDRPARRLRRRPAPHPDAGGEGRGRRQDVRGPAARLSSFRAALFTFHRALRTPPPPPPPPPAPPGGETQGAPCSGNSSSPGSRWSSSTTR